MIALELFKVLATLAGSFVAVFCYFAYRLRERRLFYADLPGPPHDFFWGHLKVMGKYTQKLPPAAAVSLMLTQIKQDYDLPDVYYLDTWPMAPGLVCLTSPEAAAHATTVNTFPQSQATANFFDRALGIREFLECTNGTLWKDLMHQLAPGLTQNVVRARHIEALVQGAQATHDRLDKAVGSQADALDLLGRHSFYVQGIVFAGTKYSEQVYQATQRVVKLQHEFNTPLALVNPFKKRAKETERSACRAILDEEFTKVIRSRYAALQETKATTDSPVTLLDRMLKPEADAGLPLSKSLMKIALDNMKGFLIAGYGTSADAITTLFIILAAFPEVLEKIRQEHDLVFGKDLRTVSDVIDSPNKLNQLDYTTAVINELLRMFPPAIGVRDAPPETAALDIGGQKFPVLKNMNLMLVGHAMHYDQKYFEDPKRFAPERWLDGTQITRDAYRPFERGLRSCIGTALAMDSMRILLVTTARSFDWELVDHEPVSESLLGYTDMDQKIGKHAFPLWSFSSGPIKGVSVKITHSSRRSGLNS